jgi:hypothetical protein
MQSQRGSESTAPLILNLGAGCGRVVNAMPRPLYLREESPVAQRAKGWVGPVAGLDGHVEHKISCS